MMKVLPDQIVVF